MPWYVPATLVTFAFTLVAANVSAEELSVLELPRGKTVEHCGIGSASASSFSRLARRSLALRPAHSRCHRIS
jgi:hypothetical protein